MGKKIAIIIIILSALYILIFSPFNEMLLMFLFLGIVPGTNYRLTPTQMLIFVISCGGIIFIASVFVPFLRRYKIIELEENGEEKPSKPKTGFQRFNFFN